MEALVVVLVLFAAALHASWNAILKHSADRALTLALVIGAGAAVYLPVLLWVPFPGSASAGYLVGSALIHLFYYAGLLLAYRFGDLSQVYPIARGTGPLVVALASGPLAGESLGAFGLFGVSLASGGVVALGSRGGEHTKRAVGFALTTGLCIGAYTLCDGLGVRAAESRLGYLAWLHVSIGLPFATVVFVVRRRELPGFWREHGGRALVGGVIATLAYSIAVFAMSWTTLAYIASLRETSVVFAAVIGAVALGEPFGRRRFVASAVVALGIVLSSFGRGG